MDPEAFVFMALSSEGEHGPGAVVVDPANCCAKYVGIGDLEPPAVRQQLGEQIQKQPENLWVVQKTVEHLHVFAYPRAMAMRKLQAGALPQLEASPD